MSVKVGHEIKVQSGSQQRVWRVECDRRLELYHASASRTAGKQADVRHERLLVKREKFAQHLMVSAGMCWGRQEQADVREREGRPKSTPTTMLVVCCLN